MSKMLAGNLLLAGSLLLSAGAQVILKATTNETGVLDFNVETLRALTHGGRLVRLGLVVTMMAAGFLLWILCLSRLHLHYAYTIACSSALFVAFLSAVVLREPVNARTWMATLLITIGTILLKPNG